MRAYRSECQGAAEEKNNGSLEINIIKELYSEIVVSRSAAREKIYSDSKQSQMWTFPLTDQHIVTMRELLEEGAYSSFSNQHFLFLIISDILIFPELYLDLDRNLFDKFCQAIDRENDLRVYFLSMTRKKIPIKPHGAAVIGSYSLMKGVAAAGAGDPKRIKMVLPEKFKGDLQSYLAQDAILLGEDVKEKSSLLRLLKEGKHFDSYFLLTLLDRSYALTSSPEAAAEKLSLQQELTKLIYSYKWDGLSQKNAIFQEAWSKPRSSQQNSDSNAFNSEYARYLESQQFPRWKQRVDHMHHPFTRSVAIREQKDVKPSTVIRNYLDFEFEKSLRDKNRTLIYNDENLPIIRFQRLTLEKVGSANCSAVATALIDTMPNNASIGNVGMSRGLSLFPFLKQQKLVERIQAFPQGSEDLRIGYANTAIDLHNTAEKKLLTIEKGSVILYDLSIKRKMLTGITKNVDRYVWGQVIADKHHAMVDINNNPCGWLPMRKLVELYDNQQKIAEILFGAEAEEKRDESRYFPLPVKWMYENQAAEGNDLKCCTFKNGQRFQLGSHEALVEDDQIFWNTLVIPIKDFKGRILLVPDELMWSRFLSRKIMMADFSDRKRNSSVVVFGTEHDQYMTFPDRFNFMPRRNIKNLESWKTKQYSDRFLKLNPHSDKWYGQQFIFGSSRFLQKRREQICEKSGLQIKHAPAILMVNRYLKTHDDFIASYLNGSKGVCALSEKDENHPKPQYITDHELYRLFSGKYFADILARTAFADNNLLIIAADRKHEATYNPFHVYCRKLGLNREDGFVSPFKLD